MGNWIGDDKFFVESLSHCFCNFAQGKTVFFVCMVSETCFPLADSLLRHDCEHHNAAVYKFCRLVVNLIVYSTPSWFFIKVFVEDEFIIVENVVLLSEVLLIAEGVVAPKAEVPVAVAVFTEKTDLLLFVAPQLKQSQHHWTFVAYYSLVAAALNTLVMFSSYLHYLKSLIAVGSLSELFGNTSSSSSSSIVMNYLFHF